MRCQVWIYGPPAHLDGMAVAKFFRLEKAGQHCTVIGRLSAVLAMLILSGCALLVPEEPLPPPLPPDLPPVIEPEPEVVIPEIVPEPVAEPAPSPPPEPQNIEPLVAIVLSNRTEAYVAVATALQTYLDEYEVYDLSDRSLLPREAFAKIAESGANAVVAVGLPAARAARRFATVPVVVGQVFNVHEGELLSDDVKAVAVLPPIGLQIEAWQQLDPSIRNVGAIIGPGHEALLEEADEAMKAHGVKLHYAVAGSDRETLYLFHRLVRDIDGFILFPDNRILSRTVLTEMMSYASRHRVQVAVFNDPLLEYGAVFSAGSVEADIAARITAVLDEVVHGRIDRVPAVTPLSEIRIRTNDEALRRLGLEVPAMDADGTLADAQ